MTFYRETHEQAEIVKVTASIFFDAVQEFDAAIQEAEDTGNKKVIVDLDGVEMICSSAITTLVKHHMSLQARGGKLFVAGCNASVKKILQLLGLDKLMGMADSVEAALK
ncbi:MAG: STAS domain-containing protein [Candidatus Riflebacteria bacterium]|nr:STAS domain-containing protein [Candidatus Riflebacteria bacterium]